MAARVEAYVDDALPPEEHARFEACLWAAPYGQKQVECDRACLSHWPSPIGIGTHPRLSGGMPHREQMNHPPPQQKILRLS